ncbi:MAG: hypothetical protein DMD79_24120 [Candidatus Rokuibacteriota bacterium]|nr:MAG: hypothetical protein DMD79_24120 [Candidatus Rokubacteria bacterium]
MWLNRASCARSTPREAPRGSSGLEGDYNQQRTAVALGLSRQGLIKKMRHYAIGSGR